MGVCLEVNQVKGWCTGNQELHISVQRSYSHSGIQGVKMAKALLIVGHRNITSESLSVRSLVNHVSIYGLNKGPQVNHIINKAKV